MLRLVSLLLLGLILPSGSALGFDHQHSLWDRVLQQHLEVSGGVSRLDYRSLRRDPALLADYLAALEAVPAREYEGWSGPRRLAFLINAYNAWTVELVVENYPVDSIKDLGGFLSSPWKKKFFTLLGKERHLDNIEHDMIRADFQEPRIHFAVNCAAISCPALRPEAFTADRLEAQLEEATRTFLTDPRRNRFDPVEGRLELSPIFRWYGGDFREVHGSVESFVAERITGKPEEQERIRSGEVKIRFLDYDWGLNDLRRP